MTSKIGGRNVTISPLEQRLLAECKDEVLWKRSIPLAIGGGAYVLLAANRGHLSFIQKLGRWPKIKVKGRLTVIGSIVGFMIGNAMGVDMIAERFVTELPTSIVTKIAKQNMSKGKGFVMTNEELIKDIQCSKQAFWYKAFPVCCAMATVAIPPSKLSTSSRLGFKIIMGICLLGALAMARNTRLEVFLKELPDSNTAKAYRRPYGRGITDDEILTFSNCVHEGVLYKAFPISLLMSAAVIYAVKKGRIQIAKIYGIWPIVLVVATIGFTLGFISNSYSCAQKFLTELPDSQKSKKFRKEG